MSAERPILIVDDDGVLRETLADQLAVDGEFTAVAAGTISEAEEKLNAKDARFDAVILDVGLPDGDGRDLCTKLRRQGQKMPRSSSLTGSDEETDVVRGADSGANDYIAKPFRMNELLARLRAATPHLREQRGRGLHHRPLHVPSVGQAVAGSGEEPPHPAGGRKLRFFEVPLPGGYRAVARQVLLNEVWGYNAAVTTHTLETHIYRLRQKIEPDPANARLLVTEGGGYGLDPRVCRPR